MRTWMFFAVLAFSGQVMAEIVRLGAFDIDPSTLEVRTAGITLSAAGPTTLTAELKQEGDKASWQLTSRDLSVSAAARGDTLEVTFLPAERKTPAVQFPVIAGEKKQFAFILPLWEGKYVPSNDRDFVSRLPGDPEDLITWSLPVMGVEYHEHMATVLFPDPTDTTIQFTNTGGQLGTTFEHKFTYISPYRPYTVRLSLSKKTSLLEPALRWRAWAKEKGEFVSLRQKVEKLPNVEKLAGAAHVYLWGADRFSRYDVKDWKQFAAKFVQDAGMAGSAANRLIGNVDPENREGIELRDALKAIAGGGTADGYLTRLISSGISRALQEEKFANEFTSRYANEFLPMSDWGDGVSAKFVRTLKKAGLDRLWLGTDGATALSHHPEVITAAKNAGYLIGHYDSFESIHLHTEKNTWETAQFPPELIPDPRALAVQRENGALRRGFQQKGFALSSIPARPAVEARVRRDMASATRGVNSVFVDCDAFGQAYNDFSRAHPFSQAQDVAERVRRMGWISTEFNAVIGSEGGVAYSTGVIHFAHGMTTPGIGWGDEEMKDKNSPYFLGAYYPSDGPAIFIKQATVKPIYHKTEFDPCCRLPLFQAAYHDSVVTTHHWSSASLKFKDEVKSRALLELLYQLPPLYHLNHREWELHKKEILRHYQTFSPLHRKTWDLPLTAFSFENETRTLQRAVFGDNAIEMIANFDDTPQNGLPPQSLRWRENQGEWQVWTP